MKTYLVNLFSEISVEFLPGNVYLIQTKMDFDKKEFLFSEDALYLNYSFNEAEKIVPFFEKLKTKEQHRIINFIRDLYGLQVRVDDLFGKFLVVLFYNLELHNLIIIGLVGLGNSSINTCIKLLKGFTSKEESKVVVFTMTSSKLSGRVSITSL